MIARPLHESGKGLGPGLTAAVVGARFAAEV
jgi:hypothetical protein